MRWSAPKDQGGLPMRMPTLGARLHAVNDQGEFGELSVQIVIGSDPVRGTATLPTGKRSDFWGWLELAEIVQSVTRLETGGVGAQAGAGG